MVFLTNRMCTVTSFSRLCSYLASQWNHVLCVCVCWLVSGADILPSTIDTRDTFFSVTCLCNSVVAHRETVIVSYETFTMACYQTCTFWAEILVTRTENFIKKSDCLAHVFIASWLFAMWQHPAVYWYFTIIYVFHCYLKSFDFTHFCLCTGGWWVAVLGGWWQWQCHRAGALRRPPASPGCG